MKFARLAGIVLFAAITVSCTQITKFAPPQCVATSPKITPARSPFAVPKPDSDLLTDERSIAAAQHALNQLGYDAGNNDGIGGPNTRRAILDFQKDRGLKEDGYLTFALAEKLRVALQAEAARADPITVRPGDLLVYDDGIVEFVATERTLQREQEGTHGLVAIRPSENGWPAPARAGLDWAITHALDMPAPAKPVKWSSTGVDQHFEIYVYPALNPREAALVGNAAQSCRSFEIRTDEREWRYPAIACRDDSGSWYIPHSTIQFARPASDLGSAVASDATRR